MLLRTLFYFYNILIGKVLTSYVEYILNDRPIFMNRRYLSVTTRKLILSQTLNVFCLFFNSFNIG